MDKVFSALAGMDNAKGFFLYARGPISGMQIHTQPEEVKTVWHSSTSLELGKKLL